MICHECEGHRTYEQLYPSRSTKREWHGFLLNAASVKEVCWRNIWRRLYSRCFL